MLDSQIFDVVLVEDGVTTEFPIDFFYSKKKQDFKSFVMNKDFLAEEQSRNQDYVYVPLHDVAAYGSTKENAKENLKTKIDAVAFRFLLDCILKSKEEFSTEQEERFSFSDSLIIVTRDKEIHVFSDPRNGGFYSFIAIGIAVLDNRALSKIKL